MIIGNVTVFSAGWTALAAIGFLIQIALVHRTMTDYIITVYFDHGTNAPLRQFVAKTSIFIFVGGLITQLAYIIVGIVSMTISRPHHLIAANYISGITLMAASLLTTSLALVIYKRRVRIAEMIQESGLTEDDKV